MPALHRLPALALVAGAFVLGAAATSASAQVKITGKEASLANHSTFGGPVGDLPPAPAPGGSTSYRNSFECIPDSVASPNTQAALPKIGEYAVKGKVFKAAPRPARGATLRR